jgi:hypothetical protein
LLERANGIALIVNWNAHHVVTVMHLRGRNARRLLRQHETRSGKGRRTAPPGRRHRPTDQSIRDMVSEN